MLSLLLVYALTQGASSEAGPIPASLERRDVASCSGQGSQRTIYGIVWSCLSTIFLCTWVAVHPNIAFRREKPQATWSEKWIWDPLHHFVSYNLPLFLCALLVPEYILAWAVRQYIQAGVIKEEVPRWTRTHGFFMIMGGIHLFRLPEGAEFIPLPLKDSSPSGFVIPSGHYLREDEEPVCPLQIDDLPKDVLEFIIPTEIQLKDKGKSDGLTKLIVIIQTLWFVIQCITRGIQHLPLTELEVVTLAYAMLNLFIYVFWWDKPRNIECPIRVYKSSAESYKSTKEAYKWKTTPFVRQMEQIAEYTIGAQDGFVDIFRRPSIPMFWSGRPGADVVDKASIGSTLLGAAFGAIHFIAWSYEFPSYAELVLWRISCVAMTVIPLFATFLCISLRVSDAIHGDDPFWLDILGFSCMGALTLTCWLYIAGRIATLVIAFTALRSLSSSALTMIDWVALIPHV